MKNTGWLTIAELAELTGVSVVQLQRGTETGLLDGLTKIIDGERRYAPDATALVAWSDRLGDDVVAGYLTIGEAHRLFWHRARQLRRRVTLAS